MGTVIRRCFELSIRSSRDGVAVRFGHGLRDISWAFGYRGGHAFSRERHVTVRRSVCLLDGSDL